ncbi:MAG: serine/threonine-protein kinase [Nannocystaceae bacterium]|nr:serine/threonine protein kinase [bacterium]
MGQAEETGLPGAIGRYRVDRKIGEGGMGVVYAGFDPELQRDVAVKLIQPGRFRGKMEMASERLRREAQITAQLAHPNVVTIYDVGESEGGVYIAMELVDGPSLARWIRQDARTWREVVSMFFGAGRGLAAAHDAGLIHRDFKPANVLVGDRRARVVDFGLAHDGPVRSRPVPRGADVLSTSPSVQTSSPVTTTSVGDVSVTISSVGLSADDVESTLTGDAMTVTVEGDEPVTVEGSVTTTGHFVGTPAYMAAEQFLGSDADARSDQFSFCVSLYEGLYGERPFAGKTASEIARNVVEGNVRPAPGRARVPGWLRNILLRGLHPDPGERHESVKALLASIWFTARIMFD